MNENPNHPSRKIDFAAGMDQESRKSLAARRDAAEQARGGHRVPLVTPMQAVELRRLWKLTGDMEVPEWPS